MNELRLCVKSPKMNVWPSMMSSTRDQCLVTIEATGDEVVGYGLCEQMPRPEIVCTIYPPFVCVRTSVLRYLTTVCTAVYHFSKSDVPKHGLVCYQHTRGPHFIISLSRSISSQSLSHIKHSTSNSLADVTMVSTKHGQRSKQIILLY